MSEYYDDGEVLKLYSEQTEKELADMRDLIVRLRAKITLLENTLQKEREDRNRLPLPKSVVAQIIELEKNVRNLTSENEYLRKYVPEEVIININTKDFTVPKRRGSGLR
jgi:predicted  nucleic acid-binding Zn-ribbon protein